VFTLVLCSDPLKAYQNVVWKQAEEAEPWGLLLAAFALVARHDPRPRVADAAAAALLDAAQKHCALWGRPEWASMQGRALAYVLDLPFLGSRGSEGGNALDRPRVVSVRCPLLCFMAQSHVWLSRRTSIGYERHLRF
jgi:hypothetical protein